MTLHGSIVRAGSARALLSLVLCASGAAGLAACSTSSSGSPSAGGSGSSGSSGGSGSGDDSGSNSGSESPTSGSDAGGTDGDSRADASSGKDAGAVADGSADGSPRDIGSCCSVHATPGCGDPNLELCVCQKNPDCCTKAWSLGCTLIVQQKYCQTGVRDCVCGTDAGQWAQTSCCSTDWNSTCDSVATLKCGAAQGCF